MTSYEKEILKAILALEEETAKELLKAYKEALKETCEAVRTLALKDIMERLWIEQPEGMNPAYFNVYQRQYEQAITQVLDEPFKRLEEKKRKIIDNSIWQYFIIGTVAAAYFLHKQKVPVIIPIQTKPTAATKNITIRFSEPQVAEWYKYERKNLENLRVRTVHDIQRHIANGESYNRIARGMAENLNRAAQYSDFRKAYNKALTIVRTEGGRIRNAAQYKTMFEAKARGADITKQWCAVLDNRTRPSHARVDSEIKELEEPFSNGLLYPCQEGAPADETINCRCTAFAKARWALSESELQNMKERAEYFGLDKTKDFEEFKEKYLKASEQ